MSDHAAIRERYLELALEEVFHGGPDSGLADSILKAASAGAPRAEVPHGPSPEDSAAGHEPGQLIELAAHRPRRPWWRYAIEGAAAACVAAALVLLLAPTDEPATQREETPVVAQKPPLPEGITAAPDANFAQAALGGGLTATAGWYVVTTDAPSLRVGEHSVEDVKGRAVVVVGGIPSEAQVRAMGTFLYQNDITEAQLMKMEWMKAGAMALCVVWGSAWVNDTLVKAQDREGKVREEKTPEAYLEQLRAEMKELKAKLERTRNMEDGEEKQARIARIENAIVEKEKQIESVEKRIAQRKGNEVEKKEDGNAQRRKDAAEKEAAERKAREAKEREREETEEEAAERKRREELEEAMREAKREREKADREAAEAEKRAKREAEEAEMRARKEREMEGKKREEAEREARKREEAEREAAKKNEKSEEKRAEEPKRKESAREAKKREEEERKRKEAEEKERKAREQENAQKKEPERRKEGEKKK